MSTQALLDRHLRALSRCDKCPAMHKPVVVGRPSLSKILLVGQAPGVKEPVLGRPFAWTAGKTLFRWIESALGWDEDTARSRMYFAAVCRCFPGKNPKGGDRVPDETEMENCSGWLEKEFDILKPSLVLPVGKLAISRFHSFSSLADIVGQVVPIDYRGHRTEMIPLPHPSGASTWHRMESGKTLLAKSLALLSKHPATRIS